MTSRRLVLGDEDEARFLELRMGLFEDLRPLGSLESLLVNRIAAQLWRLARVPAIEAEVLEGLRHDLTDGDSGLGAAWERDNSPYGGSLGRLSRYETGLERSLTRLTAELRKVQADRRRREEELGEDSSYLSDRDWDGLERAGSYSGEERGKPLGANGRNEPNPGANGGSGDGRANGRGHGGNGRDGHSTGGYM